MSNLDLTSVDQRSALLCTWKVETEPWNIDHVPVSTEYKEEMEPIKCNKYASRLNNKDTDWTEFLDIIKEKIKEVKAHNGWNK
jgi:hypothetical protein